MSRDAERRSTMAAKINKLFDDVRPQDRRGRPYNNTEVVAAIKAAHPGIRVTGAYLSALRKGIRRNPSSELRVALARFFGVESSYFLDDATAEQTEAQVVLARVARNHGVRNIALRALELSPDGLAAVAALIEQVLQSDQRTSPPTPPSAER